MIEIEFLTIEVPRLLTRREILQKEGIYHDPNYPKIRYLVNHLGECFIFNDECKIYKSNNFNMDTPKYLPAKEKIVFTATN